MDGNIFEKIIENASEKAKSQVKTYMGADGLLHCANCGGTVQTRFSAFGRERIVNCLCECEYNRRQAERLEHKEKLERERRKEMRREAFPERDMAVWTFENDDNSNPELTLAMKRYVENFREFRAKGKGLLLWGGVGTGKTFMSACVVNALIKQNIPCLMTSFSRLINRLQSSFEHRQEYIDDLDRYKLLVIDDLGVERGSDYMIEQVYNIIDSRYRAGLPLIVTTNLSIAEIKRPKDIRLDRIYSRILERCHPIEVKGVDRRRKKAGSDYDETKKILGM